ncbi:glucose 1-dehydrogenase [Gordonia alkanivorans]|uniref:SDR family NAD(P)-dependent oxidoreductase n=1 Tax=Gordonia TaxID=2053 RepID=UPI000A06D5EB|nr:MULTISPECIES: glucose 1-dehydrogenase [Gordonia]MDJ0028087.1 glucose 1-dehydrogenase [Gordonia alkanivorans]WJG13133.1 glucose 1-dehydrogenase [Gordonia sp. Swx-4]
MSSTAPAITRLKGRVALVTGGAGGQGLEHTRRLAQEGAVVHFADINAEVGAEAERTLKAEGLQVVFHQLDVSSIDQWKALAAELETTVGYLDILVNNAGILADIHPAELSTEAAWEKTTNVNQKSIFLSFHTMIPLLKKSKHAAVINTSSIFGLVGADGYLSYVASKGAVTLMTKSAAFSYGKFGIRVNSIHPGYIDTQMLRDEFAQLGEGAEEATLATIPMGRLAGPEEISPTVAFLASDDASYITGAEVLIDGGLLAGR